MQQAQRSGILAAGNWILDEVKLIDKFPEEQSLVNILDEYKSNGGSAYNILSALVRLGAAFPLEAIGLVGDDAHGRWILADCKQAGINCDQLKSLPDVPSSYTLVVSVKQSGKRTFFHHRGANAKLEKSHFNLNQSQAKIFHLGYLLLLDKLDEIQSNGRTQASEILEEAKQQGFVTTVDLVSENSDRFTNIVPCALPYVDYLFLNEFEASRLAGIDLMELHDEQEMERRCMQVFDNIFAMGVQDWIIIHFPAGVWAAQRNGVRLFQPSIFLPEGYIVGNNGAGDALAAGVLLAVHEQWPMQEALKLGVCVAAASLADVTCSDGIRDITSCLKLGEELGFRK